MGKRRRPRHKEDRKPWPQAPAKESAFIKSHRAFLELLGLIGGLLTIVAFYLTYIVPKISVSVTDSLDASNPFASIFTLTNDGALPIHDVATKCGAIKFEAGKYSMNSSPDAGIVFGQDSKAEILPPGT